MTETAHWIGSPKKAEGRNKKNSRRNKARRKSETTGG